MTNTKIFEHMDGSSYTVPEETCRGCWINDNPTKLPLECDPIWENKDIIVRQDPECPIPAFYIVSLRNHISSIADIDPEISAKLFETIAKVRYGMKEVLGIERVHLYYEERVKNPHAHFWLLPLWPEKMEKHNIVPKIYKGNIKAYIDLFKYEETKDDMISCNKKMKEFFND